MKIYTEVNEKTGRDVLEELEKVSTVEVGRIGIGKLPTEFRLCGDASAIGFNHDDTMALSNAPAPFYRGAKHAKKENAEFIRLIAAKLPREKPDLCKEIFGTDFGHTSKAKMWEKVKYARGIINERESMIGGHLEEIKELRAENKSLSENLDILNKSAVSKSASLKEYRISQVEMCRKAEELRTEIVYMKELLDKEENDKICQRGRAEHAESELAKTKKSACKFLGDLVGVEG